MFVVKSYNSKTGKTSRYDCGSDGLIKSTQPVVTSSFPYNNIIAVFNIPEKKGATMKGIDISHHNGKPLNTATEKAFKEADFVIVKATQWMSNYKYESYFPWAIEKALNAGKLAGAYHYATGLTAKKEAEYFVSVVKPYLGKIVLALDWEKQDNSSWGSKTWCKQFCDRVYELTGIYPFFYSGSDGCKANTNIANTAPLWFAGYPDLRESWNVPTFPTRYNIGDWKKYAIWQYTSGGGVDRNTTALTKSDWQKYCKSTTPSTTPSTDTTVGTTADDILAVLRSWIGKSRAKGTHKDIIDLYNSYTPRARGYKVTYTDDYCATTVSAAFIACNAVSLIGGTECGVERFIEDVFKKSGIWIEDGTITPKAGDIICYNWDDSTQPNDGWADHIGIVESVNMNVTPNKFVVIEGNMNGVVGRRNVNVGWGNIRGFARPKYAQKSEQKQVTPITVKTDTTAPNKTPKWTGQVYNCKLLNVRTWAGTENPNIKSYPKLAKGNKVDVCDTVLDKSGGKWYYVRIAGKYYGFVSKKYIKKV